MQNFRDLTIIDLASDKTLIIACDSSASIGQKPTDQLHCPPALTGAFCARVCLVELICQRAVPKLLIDMVGNELEPTGSEILAGIQQEIAKTPFQDIVLNGSTEDNMVTQMTSVGIVAIGELAGTFSKPDYTNAELVIQVGQPMVGKAVLDGLSTLPSYQDLMNWRSLEAVLDIIPVGSKGSQHDLMELQTATPFPWAINTNSWLNQSAGPSTSFVIVLKQQLDLHLFTPYEVRTIAEKVAKNV